MERNLGLLRAGMQAMPAQQSVILQSEKTVGELALAVGMPIFSSTPNSSISQGALTDKSVRKFLKACINKFVFAGRVCVARRRRS